MKECKQEPRSSSLSSGGPGVWLVPGLWEDSKEVRRVAGSRQGGVDRAWSQGREEVFVDANQAMVQWRHAEAGGGPG